MPKITYLANQMYAADVINLSSTNGNITLEARVPLEVDNNLIFGLYRDSQLFLDSVNVGSIVVEKYTEPTESELIENKALTLIKTIEANVAPESLYSLIESKVRDKIADKIAEKIAIKLEPEIFGQNFSSSEDKPPESSKTATKSTKS